MAYDEEALATAIITALTSNLGTKLAAIKAEKGDGITVPTPRLYYPAEQREIPELSATNPVVTTLVEGADTKARYVGGTREVDLAALITLGVVHSSETTLQTYCYRLSRAISAIMWDTSVNGLGAIGGTVEAEKRERSDMLASEAGGFMKITHFNFTIDYLEAF